jgi:ABC-type multidrug transport system permease subunit
MPLSQMPSYLRPFSASTLVYWATDAFNTLMLDGGGLVDIAGNLAVLFAVGIAFLGAGAFFLGRRIRKGVV